MVNIETIGTFVGLIAALYGFYKYIYQKNIELSLMTSKKKIDDYQKEISSITFNNWILEIIKKIYGSKCFGLNLVQINDKVYPSIYFLSDSSITKYPFKHIMEPLDLDNIEINEINYNKLQKEYAKILKGTIKRPKLIGYALNELKINDKNEVLSISSKLCNYEQNVMTSHILEYELRTLFKKNKSIIDSSKEEILDKLKFRNKLHTEMSLEEILLTGKGRYSLLSVQMIVLFKTKEGLYKLLLMKRSNDVAAKPGYWQFMPAGGFEMFEKENIEDKIAIQSNYNVRMAIFRELIEELYGKSEYEYNSNGNPAENILRDPHIQKIESLIYENKVFMEFLGSAIDLVTLRHEISFILRIDDIDFTNNDQFKFITNHEIHSMYEIYINEIEEHLSLGVMVPSNAALYVMAKNNTLFQEALNIHQSNSSN